MVMILREVTANGTVTNHEIGAVNQFSVTPGSTYSIIDSETGQPVEDVVLSRNGNDLLIELDGETIASLEGYYVDGANAYFYNDTSAALAASDSGAAWEASEAQAQAANGGLIAGVFGGILAGVLGSDSDGTATPNAPGPDPEPEPDPDADTSTVTVNAAAGPFITTMGVRIYDTEGNELADTRHDFSNGPVDVRVRRYSGPILIEIYDINGNNVDYLDEGTGANRSLGSSTLRAMAETDNRGQATVSVTPLTELAVLLAGIGSDNAVTAENLAFNAQVGELFDIDDILGDVVTALDSGFNGSDGLSAAEAYGAILAFLSGADAATGNTLAQTLAALAAGISIDSEGNLVLSQEAADIIAQGAQLISEGSLGDSLSGATLPPGITDTTPPTTTISGINISADSGSSDTDYITNVAAQTVTATLSAALASGERVYGSVDGGTTWTNITSSVNGTAVSWMTTLTAGGIMLQVRDAAGNQGPTASQAYTLDTTAPVITGVVVNEAGDVEVTFGSDPSALTIDPSQFTITVDAAPVGFIGAVVNGNIVTLTPATPITGDQAVSDLTTTLTDVAGNTPAPVTTVTNNSLGLSIELSKAYSTLTSSELVGISQTGDIGDDILSVNIYSGTADTGIYALDIDQLGGDGDDLLSVDLTGASIGTNAEPVDGYTYVYLTTSSWNSSRVFVASETNRSTGNIVNLDGQNGNDTLSVNFNASASTVQQYQYQSGWAGTTTAPTPPPPPSTFNTRTFTGALAAIGNNDAALYGGTGTDSLSVVASANVNLAATQANKTTYETQRSEWNGSSSALTTYSIGTAGNTSSASADVINNLFNLYGSAGGDTLAIDLNAGAAVSANYDAAISNTVARTNYAGAWLYAYANVSGNSVGVYGGDGSGSSADAMDIISVNLLADADANAAGNAAVSGATSDNSASYYVTATASVNSNSIDVYGSAGDDSIDVNLLADADVNVSANAHAMGSNWAYAAVDGSAFAYVSYNDLDIYGGDGNDLININLTASADASANGNATAAGSSVYASVYGSGSASVDSNSIYAAGSSGSDTININLIGSNDVYAMGTAQGNGLYAGAYVGAEIDSIEVIDNVITVYGGDAAGSSSDGNDNIAINLLADGYAHASGLAEGKINSPASSATFASATISADYSGSVTSNYIYAVGSAGSDTIAVNLAAVGTAFAHGTARGEATLGGTGASADVYAYASGEVSYNTISLYGGADITTSNDGNDLISANLSADVRAHAGGLAVAKASNSYATATLEASGYAYVYSNDLMATGGMGADEINVKYDAAISASATGKAQATGTSADAYIYADASAYNSSNDITLNGGSNTSMDGNDVVSLNMTADAKAKAIGTAAAVGTVWTASATLSANAGAYNESQDVYMYGGNGSDSLSLDMNALAVATASGKAQATAQSGEYASALLYASADVYNSYIYNYMYGSDGNDMLDVSLLASANAKANGSAIANASSATYYAQASLSVDVTAFNNDISNNIYGSAGSDTIDVDLLAKGVATASGLASANGGPDEADAYILASAYSIGNTSMYNYLYGGDGNGSTADGDDLLSVNAWASGSAVAKGSALADASGASFSSWNFDRATAGITAYASNMGNWYGTNSLYGSAGSDTLSVNVGADAYALASGLAKATGGAIGAYANVYADASASVLYSTSYNLYGGANSGSATGYDGNDIINLDFNGNIQALAQGTATANGANYASASVAASADLQMTNSNYYSIYGSQGSDQISLSFLGDVDATADGIANATINVSSPSSSFAWAGIWASATGYITDNSISIYGGDNSGGADGNDTINVTMDINAAAKASGSAFAQNLASSANSMASIYAYGYASIYTNDLSLYGSAGADMISVDFDAKADAQAMGLASAQSDSVGATATAYVDYNNINIYGGNSSSNDEADIIDVDLLASANAVANAVTASGAPASVASNYAYAYAYNSGNNINIQGSTGNDMISVDLSAIANANAANAGPSSVESALAYLSSNTITIDGGTGSDTINVGLMASANGASAYASIANNSLAIYGGAGDDTIGVSFMADGAFGNSIYIEGGMGADMIDIAGTVSSATGNNFTFYYGSTGEFGDSISGLDATVAGANNVNFMFANSFSGANIAASASAMAGTTDAFYYDMFATSSFALYYDADGTGSGAASTVAAFTTDIGVSNLNISYATV